MSIKLPFNSDCIIYNQFSTGTGTQAQTVMMKHFLPNVWWTEEKGSNVIRSGLTSANSVRVLLTKRNGYKTPQEWANLTREEVLSGEFYTLNAETTQNFMIKGNPIDAPVTFPTTTAVSAHFGANMAHLIMNVDPKYLPGGDLHHFEVGLR